MNLCGPVHYFSVSCTRALVIWPEYFEGICISLRLGAEWVPECEGEAGFRLLSLDFLHGVFDCFNPRQLDRAWGCWGWCGYRSIYQKHRAKSLWSEGRVDRIYLHI